MKTEVFFPRAVCAPAAPRKQRIRCQQKFSLVDCGPYLYSSYPTLWDFGVRYPSRLPSLERQKTYEKGRDEGMGDNARQVDDLEWLGWSAVSSRTVGETRRECR